MCRIVLILCALLMSLNSSFGQLLYPEIMEIRNLDVQPLKSGQLIFPANLSFLKKNLKNNHIENPAIRYAIQNLKKEKRRDSDLNNALDVLMRYAQNDTLKNMVNYIRDYVSTTCKNEEALHMVNARLVMDSIRYASDTVRYTLDSDLRTLASYIQLDSNYVWLKKVSRDSVMIEISNTADSTLKFWINNGRKEYHRFWAVNKLGDSIGTWIQVAPPGNTIRFYVDDDVYRSKMDLKKARAKKISNRLGASYYHLQALAPGELHRRYWTYYSEVEMAMGQGYVANWSGGGENSLSVLSNLRYFINYNKNKTSWENFLHYRLGFLKSGDQNIRKNEEKLELNSKVGQKAFKHWYYTAQLNILTTVFNSYEYSGENEKKKIGNFMTPGYFTLSVGMDYKPNDNFSLYLSPIAGKWTYLRDTVGIDPGRYGVDAGKKSKGDAGARVELRNKFSLFKFIDVRNELIMFSSYYNSQQSFTGNWQVQLDFKINYFMRASVYTNVVYDENYSKKLQFKENLNLGVNFRF